MTSVRVALAFAAVAIGVAAILWRKWRADAALARRRSRFFDDCLDLFEAPTVRQAGHAFPRLVGTVRGREVQVTPVIDTLTVRKLPSLWLLVTLVAPTPLRATLDLMIRPAGTESFSNFHRLDSSIGRPSDLWPERGVIRSDDPDGLPPPAVLEPHMAVFADPRAKELLVTPKGVRIVVLVDEGRRADYLVYRQAVFEVERLDRRRLADLIDRLFRIHEDLDRWKSQT